METRTAVRETIEGCRWRNVDLLAYKEDGTAPFKAITRQVLFAEPDLACELRYFEMAAAATRRWNVTITPMA
jgi:hypothetical protein